MRRRNRPGSETERAVRSPVVVVVLPGRRDRHGIAESAKDLQSQALVTESAVEALGVAVVPGTAGLAWRAPRRRRDRAKLEARWQ